MRELLLNRYSPLAPLLALAMALAVSLIFGLPASAQSEEPADNFRVTLFDNTAGPYTVKIIQSPPEAVVGSVRIIVEPVITATGEPAESAIVRVFGSPSEEGERQYSPALNTPLDPGVYVAQLEVEHAGIWGIEVEIEDEAGIGVAVAQTSVRDRVRSGGDTAVGTAIFALVSAAFVGVGFWLWHTSKKARKRQAEMRAAGRDPRTSG